MRRGARSGILVVLLAFALACSSLVHGGDAVGAERSAQPPSLDSLISLLRRVRDAYEAPGVDIETAARRLRSAGAAFRFVRDDVSYLRYTGRMQSAVGTLRTRTGNSLDRVALLGSLLKAQGYEVQYAVGGSLPPDARPRGGHRRVGRVPALKTLAARIGYDLDRRGAEARSERKLMKQAVVDVKAEVDRSYDRVKAAIGSFGVSDFGMPTNDWWWLQARRGKDGAWVTYDPTYPQIGKEIRRDSALKPLSEEPTLQLDLELVHSGGNAETLVSYAGAADGLDPTLMFVPARAQDVAQGVAPQKVSFWEPIIQVGDRTISGRPFTDAAYVVPALRGGPPVTSSADGSLVAAAPAVSSLTVKEIDATRFPEVRLTVGADVAAVPHWIASHFVVTDADQQRAVSIVDQSSGREPLVVVLDRSGSIFDDPAASAVASQALARLVDLLPADQRLGVVALGSGRPTVERELTPVGDKSALRAQLARDFTESVGGNETLVAGVSKALDLLQNERGTIVVLADGDPGGSAETPPLDGVLSRISNGDDRVDIVAVGTAVDPTYLRLFADAARTPYIEASTPDALGRSLDDIADRLTGSITIAFDAAPGAAGEHRQFSLQLQGFNGTVTGGYDIPAASPPTGPATLRLRARLRGGSDQPITAERELGRLGSAQFTGGVYQLFVGLGIYPPDVVAARFFDSWLATAEFRRWSENPDGEPPAANRSVSLTHVRIANQLNTLVDGASGTTGHPIGPGLALLATEPLAPTTPAGQGGLRTTFDVLGFASGPYGSDAIGRARWGLTVTAAEARVVDAPSTNARLVNAPGELRTYDKAPPAWLPEPAASAVRSGDWTALAVDGVTDAAWLRNTKSGIVYGVTSDGLYLAKGAAAQQVGAQFDQLASFAERYGYLCSAAFGAVGAGPLSVPCSGLVGLLQEDLKLWCFATVVMSEVGEGVQTAQFDAAETLDEAADVCHIDPGQFQKSVVKGVVTKYVSGVVSEAASDRASDAIKDKLGSGTAVRDRVVDATTSAGVDAAKGESPVGDKLERKLTDAVIP